MAIIPLVCIDHFPELIKVSLFSFRLLSCCFHPGVANYDVYQPASVVVVVVVVLMANKLTTKGIEWFSLGRLLFWVGE